MARSAESSSAGDLRVLGARAFRPGDALPRAQRAALSRDGQTLFVIAHGRLYELDADDGLERRALRSTAGFMGCVAAADDDTLLVATDQSLRWISLSKDQVLASKERTGIAIRAIAPCASRPRLSAVSAYVKTPREPAVWLFDAESPAPSPALRPCALPQGEVAEALWFTADASELRVVSRAAIHRVDPRSGAAIGGPLALQALLGPRASVVNAIAIDDDRALLSTSKPSLAIVDLARGELVLERECAATDPWYLRAPLLAGPTRDDQALVVSDGEVRRVDLRSLVTLDAMEGADALAGSQTLRGALVDRARDRAWILDERGAIHRVRLGSSAALTPTPACGAPIAARFEGAHVRIERDRSAIERIEWSSGASRFEGESGAAVDEDERRLTVELGSRVWRFDRERRTIGGPGVEVAIDVRKDALWLAVSPSERVAVLARLKELIVVDLDRRATRLRCKVADATGGCLVSDDELVLWGPSGVRWLSLGASTVDELVRGPSRSAWVVSPSPDRAHLLMISTLGALDLVTREQTRSLGSLDSSTIASHVAWSEDGRRVALVGDGPEVIAFDVEARAAEHEARSPPIAHRPSSPKRRRA